MTDDNEMTSNEVSQNAVPFVRNKKKTSIYWQVYFDIDLKRFAYLTYL